MQHQSLSGRLRAKSLLVSLVAVTGLLSSACTPGTPGVTHAESTVPPATTTLPTRPATPAVTSTGLPPLRIRVSKADWTLPAPLAREAVSQNGGSSVLVSGGLTSGDTTTARAYWLNLSTGYRRYVAPLGVPVHDTAGAMILRSDKPLVIGGGSSSSDDVVQEYHGKTNTWTVVGHLPDVRSDLTVVRAAGSWYVVGGYNGRQVADPAVLASKDGTSWTTEAQLKKPVRYPATAATGQSIWVFGGERNGVQTDTVQRIDLSTGKTKVVAHLPQPLGHASAITAGGFNGRILLCGGRTNSGGVSKVCRWFDTATMTFSTAGRLPWPVADSAVAIQGSTIYLLGGETPSVTDGVVQIKVLGLPY